MTPAPGQPVLVTGATGFVGRALVTALLARGLRVRATTRARGSGLADGVEWFEADLRHPASIAPALAGARSAYYLVHGMADPRRDYAEAERLAAAGFALEAAQAGLERVVYLGGTAPQGQPSRHLGSRLAVGELLRAGRVPCLELRASMIVGSGSASWKVVRDLALRLPAMVLPGWARARSSPVAIEDVVVALVAGLDFPLPESAWYDLPGPEVLSVRQIFEAVAAQRGRRLPALEVPLPTPRLSSLWLKLVSGADFQVARELVQGLLHDLLPRDDRFRELAGLPPRLPFAEAARRALATDPPDPGLRGLAMAVEEYLVDRLSPRLAPPLNGGGGARR